jgi:hypothetical protein
MFLQIEQVGWLRLPRENTREIYYAPGRCAHVQSSGAARGL